MPGSDEVKSGAPRVKLTYEDFVLFPDDGQRHELIDGEHYVTPAPNITHQGIVGNLYFSIRAWLEAHEIGKVFLSPLDVVFTRFDIVEPDLLYMSNERATAILTEKHVSGTPELVIEIGSPSTRKRDETIKRQLYERSGVSEYWVVDPEIDVVRVYRNESGEFQRPIELSAEADDVLTTPLLPGLRIRLAQIFSSS
jgi:Uma2 family endonuclease